MLFYLRKFNDIELYYLTLDKELLAIVQMFRKYPHYLKKTRFLIIIKNNHKNLQTFTTKKKLIKKQVSQYKKLSNINFLIKHIQKKENIIADVLNR